MLDPSALTRSREHEQSSQRTTAEPLKRWSAKLKEHHITTLYKERSKAEVPPKACR